MESVRSDSAEIWEFAAADAAIATKRRRDFALFLRRYGTPESDYEAAEVIFAELVANVMRHAPGAIRIIVEWRSVHAILHVIDRGAGFSWQPALPCDPLTESQRGLFIVSRLSPHIAVSRRSGRETLVSVELPVARRGSPGAVLENDVAR